MTAGKITCLTKSPLSRYAKADTEILQTDNTTGEGISKKNPAARIQDGGDNIFSLGGARLCNK
jgi:hypothetical protein